MSKTKDNITKRRLQTSYITSTVSISLVLFLVGLMGLLILNSQKISNYVKENIGFSVIIKENAKEAEIIKLKKRLDASDYVKSTKFISKDEAADELQAELGEDFTDFIGYNPLSSSIDVKLYADYTNIDSINVIVYNRDNSSYMRSLTITEAGVYHLHIRLIGDQAHYSISR